MSQAPHAVENNYETTSLYVTLQQIRSQPQKYKFICNLVFQKDPSSRCVPSMHKPSKHDHVIYGAAKVNNQPYANLLLPKYLRNHKHNNKFLTTMKPQSESCCQKSADAVHRQLAVLSRKINATISPVYTSRKIKDEIKVREDKPPCESTMRCLSFSV